MKVIVSIPDTIRNKAYGLYSGYYEDKIVSVDSIGYYEQFIEAWNAKEKARLDEMVQNNTIINQANDVNNISESNSTQDNLNDQMEAYDAAVQNIGTVRMLIKDYNWYNIDRFVTTDVSMNVKIKIKNLETKWCNTYVFYDELKSVVYNVHYNNEFSLTKIPFLDNTRVVISTEKNGKIYFQEVMLEKSQSTYEINLKETTLEALERLILKK